MTVLMGAFIGISTLVVGLLVRAAAAVALLGLLLTLVLIGVFGWYWLTLVYHATIGIRRVGHLHWRRDCYYTPGHLWLRPMRRQTVRLGVDDIAQRLLLDVGSIALPAVGTRVGRGEPIALIGCGHGQVVLRAPVPGTIAAANSRLVNAPALLHRDPYRRGWFVELEPQDVRFDGFAFGGRARAWLANEERRLTEFFERALGVAAADGGELIRTAPETLTDDQWSTIREAFLEPVAQAHQARYWRNRVGDSQLAGCAEQRNHYPATARSRGEPGSRSGCNCVGRKHG
jgi:glycine cleavage system H protein